MSDILITPAGVFEVMLRGIDVRRKKRKAEQDQADFDSLHAKLAQGGG